jgi:hypothetical protein
LNGFFYETEFPTKDTGSLFRLLFIHLIE